MDVLNYLTIDCDWPFTRIIWPIPILLKTIRIGNREGVKDLQCFKTVCHLSNIVSVCNF